MAIDTPETFRVRAPQQRPGEAIERLSNLIVQDDHLAASQEDQAETEDVEAEEEAVQE